MHMAKPNMKWKILGKWVSSHIILAHMNGIDIALAHTFFEYLHPSHQPAITHGKNVREVIIGESSSQSKDGTRPAAVAPATKVKCVRAAAGAAGSGAAMLDC